jgi:hypothetical protein
MHKHITLPDVKARAVHFANIHSANERYVVFPQWVTCGDIIHDNFRCRQATGVNLAGDGERFFLVYVEDCFAPPVAIVRADNEQDAEELFVQELPWARLTEEQVEDINEDDVGIGPNGELYDQGAVRIHEVRPVHIELA